MDQLVSFLPDLAMLVGAGFLAGIVAGLFGVGGGTITVPILFHWFLHIGVPADQAMHSAVGTSLATIIATSLSSAKAHQKRGSVDKEIFKNWVVSIGVGSALGAGLAAFLSGSVLRGFFGVFLLCVALYMLATKEGTVIHEGLPKGWAKRLIVGGIGVISSLVGIGGGAMSVPTMSLCGVPMQKAVGTSSAFGTVIAIPGTIGFILGGWAIANLPPYSMGYVNLMGLAVLLPTTALMAPLGAKLAHKLDRAMLRRIFSIFLAFIALKMLWGLFGK